VTNTCCGLGVGFLPGARDTVVVDNDGRDSEIALSVEGDGGANTEGMVLRGNFGVNLIEDDPAATVRNRSVHTLEEF